MPGAQPELDRGSYLSAYGLLNRWTLWLLAHEPELVSLRPSELQQPSKPPPCPQCGRPMAMRAYVWRCYNIFAHAEPVTLAPGLQTPKVKWAEGERNVNVLALAGRDDVDVMWQDSQGGTRPEGYVIIFRRRPDVPRTKDLAKAVSGRGRRHQNLRRADQ